MMRIREKSRVGVTGGWTKFVTRDDRNRRGNRDGPGYRLAGARTGRPAARRAAAAAAAPARRQLVEPRHQPGAGRRATAPASSTSSATPAASTPTGAARPATTTIPTPSTASPSSSCPAASRSCRSPSATTTRATSARRADRRAIRCPRRRRRSPAGSKAAIPATSPPDGDRHMLVVDRDNRILYELYQAHWNAGLNRWEAGSGAVFPLTTNLRRPDTWTSADAAGLAILPGLVRYDEAFGADPIRHAFRVTVRATNGYVFPASHRAGIDHGALPMGARLRLKASVNISTYPAVHPAHLPGDEDLRADRRRQRLGHVHHRHVRSALGSVHGPVEHRVQSAQRQHVRGGAARMESGARQHRHRRRRAARRVGDAASGSTPNSSAGANGASGDPDGDGLTNAQERAGGTHPRGFFKRLFAEGVSNDFFTTRFAALNTGGDAGARAVPLPAHRRRAGHARADDAARSARHARSAIGRRASAADPYSTVVESDVEVVVDRTMSWDATRLRQPRRNRRSPPPRRRGFSPKARRTARSICSICFRTRARPTRRSRCATCGRPAWRRSTRPTPWPANSRFTIWVDQERFAASRCSPRPTSRRRSRRRCRSSSSARCT